MELGIIDRILERAILVKKNEQKIKKELKEIEKMVFNIEEGNKEKKKKDLRKCKTYFPITEENFQKLEDKLKKKNFFASMVEYLGNMKGNSEALLVLEILKECVTDQFANEYSLRGMSGKSNFSNLEFYACIIASVEERFKIDKDDPEQRKKLEVIVNDTISNFLSKANERILKSSFDKAKSYAEESDNDI